MADASIQSVFQTPLSVVVQTQQRWLAVILFIFLFLILITTGFTLSSLSAIRRDTATLEIITQQKALRSRYINQVFLTSQGIKTSNTAALLQRIRHYLTSLQHGSQINTTFDGETQLSLPSNPAIQNEITRKLNLLNTLEIETKQLLNTTRNTAQYRSILSRVSNVIDQLEDPRRDLLTLYLTAARQSLNQRFLLAMLLITLSGGLGVVILRQHTKAQQILSQSEEHFRQIFDAPPIGKTLISPQGKWLRVNPPFCELLGYTELEMQTHPAEVLTDPSDLQTETRFQEKLLKGEIKSYQLNKRLFHKDGHLIWTLATGCTIWNKDHNPIALVVHHLNITDQLNTLEALRVSETKYRNIFESVRNGIIIAGMDGYIISANHALHEIFGYAVPELQGQLLTLLMPSRYQSAHHTGMQRVLETRTSKLAGQNLQLFGLRKDNTEFPLELTLSTWEDPQKNLFCTAIIRDITDRRQAEEQRAALIRSNKALGEFAAIATHDLQEPLRKIGFYTELIATKEKEKLDAESLQYTSRVLFSVERMQNLIRDLMSYSEVSLQTLELSSLDLNRLIQEVLQVLAPQIENTQAEIQVDSLPIIMADPNQIHALFEHLIQNALKFYRNGVSPIVHIYGNLLSKESLLGPTEFVEVSIQDNGIGFDLKYLDRIFKVFQRLHPIGEYAGTGIGLATCKRIIEQHHGTITANSKLGFGSTFIVTLPVWQSNIEETGKFQ